MRLKWKENLKWLIVQYVERIDSAKNENTEAVEKAINDLKKLVIMMRRFIYISRHFVILV